MVNKYVGITNYDAFTQGVANKDINIENKKAIVVKGKLADRIVTQKAAGKSVGMINAIVDIILSAFSKDYRAAKSQASDLFGRFEKRHYANTEEGRAVYFVYKKVLTEKLKQMFGKDNSVNAEDMARLKKETWTLANNNPALAKEIYAEHREGVARKAATKANANVTAYYMAQKPSSENSSVSTNNEEVMKKWHADADKARAEYFDSKYIFTQPQAADVRVETLLKNDASKPASPEKAAEAADLVAKEAKGTGPVADFAEAVRQIEIIEQSLTRALEAQRAADKTADKNGSDFEPMIAILRTQLAEQKAARIAAMAQAAAK